MDSRVRRQSFASKNSLFCRDIEVETPKSPLVAAWKSQADPEDLFGEFSKLSGEVEAAREERLSLTERKLSISEQKVRTGSPRQAEASPVSASRARRDSGTWSLAEGELFLEWNRPKVCKSFRRKLTRLRLHWRGTRINPPFVFRTVQKVGETFEILEHFSSKIFHSAYLDRKLPRS